MRKLAAVKYASESPDMEEDRASEDEGIPLSQTLGFDPGQLYEFRSLIPSGEVVSSVPEEDVLAGMKIVDAAELSDIGLKIVDAAELSDIGSEIEVGEDELEEPGAGARLIRFIVKDKKGNIRVI